MIVCLCAAVLAVPMPARGQEAAGWAFGTTSVEVVEIPDLVRGHPLLLELEHAAGARSVPAVRKDLNEDGVAEYIVQSAPSLCGTAGCVYGILDGATGRGLGTVFGGLVHLRAQRINDLPIIETYASVSARSAIHATYVYDGAAYARVTSIEVDGATRERLLERLEQVPMPSSASSREWVEASLDGGRYLLDAPVELSWELLAPRDLVGFDVASPPPRLLDQLRASRDPMFGFAEVRFDAPLPDELRALELYLVSESGIRRLEAESLHGVVRYQFVDDGSISSRSVFGYVQTRPESGDALPQGGLVLAVSSEVSFEVSASSLAAKELVPPSVAKRWGELSRAEREYWVVEHQYGFRIGDDPTIHVFVKWSPDDGCFEACCSLRYSVFDVVVEPVPVAAHAAECDI